ncbi:MAG: hypothetical protein ABIE36_01425, partial [Candidatus Diapherotrites archaeon]
MKIEKEMIFPKKIILVNLILCILFLISLVSAIPQTFNIHGKLTDSGGNALSGTYNMSFRIYDAYTDGNTLWSVINQSITTDSDGVYSTILNAINLSFSEQYYLGITVESDDELLPRTNLTSSGYTFRANVTDYLDATKSYEISNLTITQKITFALGEIIDNIVDGWIRVTGGLNVTGNIQADNVTANYFIGDGSYLTNVNGSGLYIPYTNSNQNVALGDYNFSVGTSDFFVNSNGNVGIGTTAPTEKLFVDGNIRLKDTTDHLIVEGDSGAFIAGYSSSPNRGIRHDAPGSAGGWYGVHDFYTGYNGAASTLAMRIKNGNVGIGTTSPNKLLHVAGTSQFDNTITLGATSGGTITTGSSPSLRAFGAYGSSVSLMAIKSGGTQKAGVAVIGADQAYPNVNMNEGQMFIDGSLGNVGIGTTSPNQKLQVMGIINASGAIYENNSSRVCTAENGFCGTSSAGAGWT